VVTQHLKALGENSPLACGNHLMCQECEVAGECTILPPAEMVQSPDHYKVGGTD
jgi:hypothetical protein